jgi:hypothetical protein
MKMDYSTLPWLTDNLGMGKLLVELALQNLKALLELLVARCLENC